MPFKFVTLQSKRLEFGNTFQGFNMFLRLYHKIGKGLSSCVILFIVKLVFH